MIHALTAPIPPPLMRGASTLEWVEAVYDEHVSAVFGLALRITGDASQAERAVEHGFARWLESSAPPDAASAGSLLRGAVYRAARDLLRASRHGMRDLDAVSVPAAVHPSDRVDVGPDRALPAGLRVVPFPATDAAFATHVDHALATTEMPYLRAVERVVRAAYPSTRFVMSLALADLVPGDLRLYAYRDGSILGSLTVEDWWLDRALPRTIAAADHCYVQANEAAVALFGVGHHDIIGVPAGSFTRHETDPAIGARLFALLDRTGAVTSTAIVIRPDGTELEIDFHTELDGVHHITTMRERLAS